MGGSQTLVRENANSVLLAQAHILKEKREGGSGEGKKNISIITLISDARTFSIAFPVPPEGSIFFYASNPPTQRPPADRPTPSAYHTQQTNIFFIDLLGPCSRTSLLFKESGSHSPQQPPPPPQRRQSSRPHVPGLTRVKNPES